MLIIRDCDAIRGMQACEPSASTTPASVRECVCSIDVYAFLSSFFLSFFVMLQPHTVRSSVQLAKVWKTYIAVSITRVDRRHLSIAGRLLHYLCIVMLRLLRMLGCSYKSLRSRRHTHSVCMAHRHISS